MQDESGFFGNNKDISTTDISTFHDFRLINESERGFARIFTARKDGRVFVIKTLRENIAADATALAALRKEYDAAYHIDSRHVARTFDFTDIAPYGKALVIEYCAGSPLSRFIEEGTALGEEDVDTIVDALTKALDDIHACGILHRDIKPSNIIWSSVTRTLKVIDFGCADSDTFYLLRGHAGTERYTHPAVLADEKREDRSCDYYAAGMTLMQLAAIAPEGRRKALESTAAGMMEGRITRHDEALRCYSSHLQRGAWRAIGRHKGIAAAIAVVFVTAAAATFIALRSPENEPKPQAAVAQPKASVSDTATPATHEPELQTMAPKTDEAAVPAEASERVSEKAAEVREEAQEAPSILAYYALPGEEIKNEYGVCRAEAKYTACFSRNPIDKFVVEGVTDELTECVRKKCDTQLAEEERELARKRYYSFKDISEDIWRKTKAAYPDADRRRVLGLVKERMKYMHSR